MAVAGTLGLLNEGIRSGYSSLEIFEQQLAMSNCLIPLTSDPYGCSDAFISCEDSDDSRNFITDYSMMELLDQNSIYPSEEEPLFDLDVFEYVFSQDQDSPTPPPPPSVIGSATIPDLLASLTPSPSPRPPSSSPPTAYPPPVASSPADVYGFMDRGEDEDEYEGGPFRNIPVFVASGSLSEDEGEVDDDEEVGFTRRSTGSRAIGSKSKTDSSSHNNTYKYASAVVPRTITDVVDNNNNSVVTPRRVRRRKDQLWYFLLEILGDPEYNPNYIQWENKDQGIFRFIESKKVAQLWGAKKKRTGMSYEYFARAMRHYYSRGIMRRVTGRRLVYQFGPKAENWKNYAQQVSIGHHRLSSTDNNSNSGSPSGKC